MWVADVLRDMDQDQCMAWRTFGSDWADVGGALAEFDVEEDVVLTASEVLERQASEIQCVHLLKDTILTVELHNLRSCGARGVSASLIS